MIPTSGCEFADADCVFATLSRFAETGAVFDVEGFFVIAPGSSGLTLPRNREPIFYGVSQ